MEGLQPTIDIGGNNNGMGNWGGALIGGAIGGAVGSAWGSWWQLEQWQLLRWWLLRQQQQPVCDGVPDHHAFRRGFHRS